MMRPTSLARRPGMLWPGLLWPTLFALLSVTILPLLSATPALAAPTNGSLRIEPIAAYNFVVDSNVLSPSTYAPEAGTLGAKVCNDGSTTLTDVFVYIGSRAANTPGVYPARTHAGLQGTHALTHEGGTAGTRDASRYIPSLGPGQCAMQYWLVSYPRTALSDGTIVGAAGTRVAVTLGIKPEDDLYLFYDMWASANEGGTVRNVDVTRRVTMRNEISAAANKIWPNTASKVPQEYLDAIATALGWNTLTPSGSTVAYPGQTVTTQGIWYDLGNVGFGFDNNFDGAPDQNAWLQPIGDPKAYDPGCFRLVRTYGILIVKLKSGGEQLIPFVDQLYFEGIPENTGVVGLVYYQYAALDGSCTAGLSPYQEVASGYDNEKFSGDYGFGIPPLQSRTPAVAFIKGVDKASIPSSPTTTLNYTIAMTNSASEPSQFAVTVGDPALGIPLVISDAIPAGTDYLANSATAVGATVSPGGVRIASVRYSTDSGTTWTTTQPAAASVTNIQWWMDRGVPQGDTVTVNFSVTAPVAPPAVSTIAVIPNTATASFGTAPPFAQSTVRTLVSGPNSLSGNVFRDNGTGAGLFGNSIYDSASGETLLPNVSVDLYYDADGDGVVDTDEPLVASTAAAYTGAYSFGSLADGKYIVRVNTGDSDIPTGWTNTTRVLRTADLDSAGALPGGVTVGGLNFGFAPALMLHKNLISPSSPVYEGELVTFGLSVHNTLPGSGTASTACSYVIPATIAHPTTGVIPPGGGNGQAIWSSPNNALGLPDGSYAGTNMNNNADFLGLSGFNLGDQGGTISKVEYRFTVRERLEMRAGDYMAVQIYSNDAVLGTNIQYNGASAPFNGGLVGSTYTHSADITALRAWTWADFSNNLTEIRVEGTSAGGNPAGEIDLDSLSFIVTTNQTCGGDDTIISTVPLTDTFDPALLQFVSASVAPDSTATSGTPARTTLSWNNVGPLYPGQQKTIQVTFRALAPGADNVATTNFAGSTGARYRSGRTANNAYDNAPIALNQDGLIAGRVFGDATNNGWQTTGNIGDDSGDIGIPGVTVELYACVELATGTRYVVGGTDPATTTNSDCPSQGTAGTAGWRLIASTSTAADGTYSFTGLRPGFYVVQVADGSPDAQLTGGVTASTLPSGIVQSAEGANSSPPNSNSGFTCSGGNPCDGVWGVTSGNTGRLSTANFNPIDTSNETISNVDFGYNTSAILYGNVWQDDDGNGVRATTDNGIGAVTVTLRNCGANNICGDGDDSTNITDTTDANGNYAFAGLTVGRNYQVTVNTATLPGGSTGWAVTAETDGSSNNVIQPATIVAGSVSGSHNFGFARGGNFSIGDTLYYDWDADGTQDAGVDEGIPGVDVFLYSDEDGDGTIDAGIDSLIATQVSRTPATAGTDPIGFYRFNGLPNGNYIVVVNSADPQFPAGFPQTQDPDEAGICTACDSRSTETISGANVTTADFGYRPSGAADIGDTVWYDANGDGVQSGVRELGIANVTVNLQVDFNGDGTFVTVRSAVTDASGKYLFANLPNGTYRVVVDAADPDIPNDAFGNNYAATTPITRTVALSGTDNLTADFGFTTLAAIGDTVYYDINNNGQQDYNEPGIAGVTVTLANADAFTAPDGTAYAAGAFTRTATTDASGKYLFSGLPAIPTTGSGVRYTVTATPPGGRPQTGDPDRDGENCASTAYPGLPACDNATTQRLYPGSNFTGADFGYLPTGILGDTLWVDADGNGRRDAGEYGIPYVTVRVNGPGCAPCTATTDANGEYLFSGLADGTYTVSVDSTDADLTKYTAGQGLVATYEPNNTPDNSISVTLAGGVVTQLDGLTSPAIGTPGAATACTAAGSCSLVADFGYRFYSATGLSASGTVCQDGSVTAGVCGATPGTTSGVDAAGGESAFSGETVWLYRWLDDGDGTIESGETVLAAVTTTNASGDYSFTNLPATSGSSRYIVALAAPTSGLQLTTTGSAPSFFKTDANGTNVSASRSFTLTDNVTNQDFAYASPVSYDFGDLPDSYSTTLQGSPDGARHSVAAGQSLYLGTTPPDAETNGAPTTAATGDDATGGVDDENGVVVPTTRWVAGASGGSVNVTVSGSGYLVGWIDFNQDGDFSDAGEMVIDRGVSAGTANYAFTVPTGVFTGTGSNVSLAARFRLFSAAPTISKLAYSGTATSGEVEDYRFLFTPNAVTLASFDAAAGKGGLVTLTWSTGAELGVAGFYILRSDSGDRAGAVRITPELIEAAGDSVSGASYTWVDETPAGEGARYWLEVVNVDGSPEEYGPVKATVLSGGGTTTTLYLPLVSR